MKKKQHESATTLSNHLLVILLNSVKAENKLSDLLVIEKLYFQCHKKHQGEFSNTTQPTSSLTNFENRVKIPI